MTVRLPGATEVEALKGQITHVGRQFLPFRDQFCQDHLEDTQLPFTNVNCRIMFIVIPCFDITCMKFPNIS